MICTEAWVQVVSDDARAQEGVPSPQSLGESRVGEGERQGAGKQSGRARQTSSGALGRVGGAHSERAVSEVCTHPPGLPRDEPTVERSVAPTAADSPFLVGGNSLVRTKLPSSKASWRTSAVNRAERRREVIGRRGAGLLRQGH